MNTLLRRVSNAISRGVERIRNRNRIRNRRSPYVGRASGS